ncbi:MAG: sugar transferase [Chlorobi bacterium]|nr:sugar transferase [Chlorobiota bacterium]
MGKRLFDIVFAGLGFCMLSPLMLMIVVLILILDGGSPFFVQQRIGKNGHPFLLVKFKTMNNKTDKEGNYLADKVRLTPIGKFLRKTSLDEVPQFLNVLKGDMSLVGPRPLLIEYLPLYNEFQKRRLEVKPGITGWAQVNGRNAISWSKKFELDVWYVDHLSFGLDLKIMLLTLPKIFRAEDISQKGEATMEYFKGNQ